jgi:hypothetical protein
MSDDAALAFRQYTANSGGGGGFASGSSLSQTFDANPNFAGKPIPTFLGNLPSPQSMQEKVEPIFPLKFLKSLLSATQGFGSQIGLMNVANIAGILTPPPTPFSGKIAGISATASKGG